MKRKRQWIIWTWPVWDKFRERPYDWAWDGI